MEWFFRLKRRKPNATYRFSRGDKDGKYEDYLVDPEISLLVFDGYGGLGSPRGRYQKTTEVIEVEGTKATVWALIDSMR
jgi:hypothetical protein